jgi:hypothetical protein
MYIGGSLRPLLLSDSVRSERKCFQILRARISNFSGGHYVTLTCPCSIAAMADMRTLKNDRTRAANSDVDILGKLDYWRACLHECGLHTEAMVMGRAASEIRILRGQVSEKISKRRA